MSDNQPSVTPLHCEQPMTQLAVYVGNRVAEWLGDEFDPKVTEWQCDECKTKLLLSWISSKEIGLVMKGMYV